MCFLWNQVTEFLVIYSVDQIVIKTLKNTLIVRCLEERQIDRTSIEYCPLTL